jgi:hypothetical protein
LRRKNRSIHRVLGQRIVLRGKEFHNFLIYQIIRDNVYFIPYTVAPGIDTVAVPDFDVDLLGHAYFAQAEALLHDIHDLMRHNETPAQRQRIMPWAPEGTAFWRLRR